MTTRAEFARVESSDLPRRGTSRERFDDRSEAMERWLDGLPLADVGGTGRQIHAALTTLHTIGLSPRRRLAVLGRLEPVVDFLVDRLRKLYLRQALPLPTRGRNANRLVLMLREEMARGYRLALMMDRGGILGLRRRQRAEASLQACRHAGLSLVEKWLLYDRPIPGTWTMLHEVWTDAQRRGISLIRVATDKDGHPHTVDATYKQLLLTEAADPWHMAQGEVLEIHRLLGAYAGEIELAPCKGPAADNAVFMVDQTRDLGPTALAGGAVPDSDAVRIIVTESLSRAFDAYARKDGEAARRHQAGGGSLRKRIESPFGTLLGRIAYRRQERSPISRGAVLVVGLSRIHEHLTNRGASAQNLANTIVSRFHARDLPVTFIREPDDVWDLIYDPDPRSTPSGWPKAGVAEAERLVAEPVQNAGIPSVKSNNPLVENFWRTVDSSDRGYRLVADADNDSRAAPGRLVLFAETDGKPEPNWQIGVIRWVRKDGMSDTHLGIEKIGLRPHPVFTHGEQDSGRLSNPSRGLLVPAIPDLQQPVTLIVPPGLYQAERRVRLLGEQKTGEVYLERELASTAQFCQFAFSRLDSEDRFPGSRQRATPQYEALWASI